MENVKLFHTELMTIYEGKPPVSKARMSQITKAALKSIKNYKHIVLAVEKFVSKAPPEYKLAALYVIDSIVRQSQHQFGAKKDVFGPRFAKNLYQTFKSIYKCVPEDKSKVIRVLNLWQKNETFFTDVIQPILDLANPKFIEKLTSSKKSQKEFAEEALKVVNDLLTKCGKDPHAMGINPQHYQQLEIIGQYLKQQLDCSKQTSDGDISAITVDAKVVAQLKELAAQLFGKVDIEDVYKNSIQNGQNNEIPFPTTIPNSIKDNTSMIPGFNKKLLDFDYGDEEDENFCNQINAPEKPTVLSEANITKTAQNILTDPVIMNQIQQHFIKPFSMDPHYGDMHRQILAQQQDEFDKQINCTSSLNDLKNESYQHIPGLSPSLSLSKANNHNMLYQPLLPTIPSFYSDQPLHRDIKSPELTTVTTNKDYDLKCESNNRLEFRSERDQFEDVNHKHKKSSHTSSSSKKTSISHHKDEREKSRTTDKKSVKKSSFSVPFKSSSITVLSRTIWIGRVPKNCNEQDLRKAMNDYSITPETINMVPPRGCAYVCFKTRSDANRILDKMKDRYKLFGKTLQMDWSPFVGLKDNANYKLYWNISLGVYYIPYDKIDINTCEKFNEGGLVDWDSVPKDFKNMIQNDKNTQQLTDGSNIQYIKNYLNLPPPLPIGMPSIPLSGMLNPSLNSFIMSQPFNNSIRLPLPPPRSTSFLQFNNPSFDNIRMIPFPRQSSLTMNTPNSLYNSSFDSSVVMNNSNVVTSQNNMKVEEESEDDDDIHDINPSLLPTNLFLKNLKNRNTNNENKVQASLPMRPPFNPYMGMNMTQHQPSLYPLMMRARLMMLHQQQPPPPPPPANPMMNPFLNQPTLFPTNTFPN
ncbi:unnamed protein product [Gordionus sp. m RMFG-2023]